MPKRTAEAIERVLAEGVAEILPDPKGLGGLMHKKKIRLYMGVDPTSPYLHLGHAVALRKLRQFQNLGHEVVLLFGTFTAGIGDPTGRDASRQPLSASEIRQNMKTYKRQAGKILDLDRTLIAHNHAWLGRLRFHEVLQIASNFTAAQLLERDMFQERMKKGEEVWMHELMYPVLQAYDSVGLDVDLEVGGTDQTFNMLMGRRLQRVYHNKEKYVLTCPLLLGTDGRKMSKSYGNTVNIEDPPADMFGKLMSIKDELIAHYFELAAGISQAEIRKLQEQLKDKGVSVRDLKTRLAKEVVTIYYGQRQAEAAAQEFERVFRNKQTPEAIKEVGVASKEVPLIDLLVLTGLVQTRSEARRVVSQGGAKIDGTVAREEQKTIPIQSGMVVQVGKRKFVRIRLTK